MNTVKIYAVIITLFVFSHASHAQKQLSTWYFGTKVGLNFNATPPQVLSNGNGNSVEGCATISDGNGDLLFYTNGVKIVNKQHETMLNGDNILGDLSSTSGVIIVPQSGSNSIYYVFTIGSAGQSLKGFKYNVVDITRNGGLGEVTQKNVYSMKTVMKK